ncbi:NCS2 family permease [Erysipelothrix sp. HDW6C]|uniref:NCS2 family permease n=1 Tax=Erysipelothrix sp. HDW6C TaxID=2714930 RepID=UPI001407B23F|nr:NCS2 family permease [Erysipelothrix sp. HDW6C]QIK69638.1 NCS2 family permease [Erysipelothrix sp. HDW6C]
MKNWLNQYFGIEAANSTIKREFTGGLTAFLSMSYVIFVNPIVLGRAGMPEDAVFMATILSSAIGMLIMGFYAKFPMGVAPCMSMNAFFAFSVVIGMGMPWQTALASVLVAAILFLILSLSGFREKLTLAIPQTIKQAGNVGLGIFIAFVSFKNSGIIVPDESMFIAFGGFKDPNVIIAIVGIVTAAFFLIRRNRYAVFFGMLGAAVCGLGLRFMADAGILVMGAETLASLPQLPAGSPVIIPTVPFQSMLDHTFLVAIKEIPNLFNPQGIMVVLIFLFLDFFGASTTLSAAASQIDDVPAESFENNKKVYIADAIGVGIGGILGTSSLAPYIESVSGILAGARTGLMSVVTAGFFLLAAFFYPTLSLITSAVTTPAMVLIGIFMMQNVTNINWRGGFEEVIPAFITIIMMPLSGSVALGLTLGFVSYELCMIFAGRGKELGPVMHFIALISIAYMVTL